MNLGLSALKLDAKLTAFIDSEDRSSIWRSASAMLDKAESGASTVMGLGYVQSGKTTSISALSALASDRGYRLVIAILGTTILLKNQNRNRVEENLGLDGRDYVWHSISTFNIGKTEQEVEDFLARGRTVFIPVIKNARVIDKVAEVFRKTSLAGVKTLIIDDEADQASLNTRVDKAEESSTYAAINKLRGSVGEHVFVQYTATPYAPILLEPDDPLMPHAVEFLIPGKGYTGGREFFYTHAKKVIRYIPESDEQSSKQNMSTLPRSLITALAGYFAGAVHLWTADKTNAPISMLVHSSFKNAVQEQYRFLIRDFFQSLKSSGDVRQLPFNAVIQEERQKLYDNGISPIDDDKFHQALNFVIGETSLWLVNSSSDVKSIKWNSAPFHVLIGGNKLDRGFTVEGLTVTYMNRPPSTQIDTLEQRARAFGYRTNLLPYCLFFATAKTIKYLRGIVNTEDDLRISLKDSLDAGRSVAEWAKEIGLLLPGGMVPSRTSVIPYLLNFNPDGSWLSLRKPDLGLEQRNANVRLLQATGIFNAPTMQIGRIPIRAIESTTLELHRLLQNWRLDQPSPGWQHEEILSMVSRTPIQNVLLVLMNNPQDGVSPRVRSWDSDTGFTNLFQGRDVDVNSSPDNFYPGDRDIHLHPEISAPDEKIIIQVHHVQRRGFKDSDLYTLAIRIPGHAIVRRA